MEKIVEIKEVSLIGKGPKGSYETSWEGYEVITTQQSIKLLIGGDQCCCEHYGYLMTEDAPKEFIGAELQDVRTIDEKYLSESMRERANAEGCFSYDGGAVFVNLETDRGPLQFVIYNLHNGYYGHDIWIHSNQMEQFETL